MMIKGLINQLADLVSWTSELDEESATSTVIVKFGPKTITTVTDLTPVFRAYDKWKARQ